MLLKARGLDYRATPLAQELRRIGVASVLVRRFESLPEVVDRQRAREALTGVARWILITRERQPVAIMPAADLARQLQDHPEQEEYSLLDIPAERREVTPVDFQSSLQEALGILNSNEAEALYVIRHTIPGISRVYGVLTREDIDRSYSVH